MDARTIAAMLLSDAGLKPYTDTAYHSEELKSLTRYRFDKVKERAKLKSSVSRLVCILFPELDSAHCLGLRLAGGVLQRQTGCKCPFDQTESSA